MAEPTPTNHTPDVELTPEPPDTTTLTEILSVLSSDVPLTTPSSQTYLTHLTSLPLQELLTEPTVLQTQSHHLTSSLTSLTHASYPAFLSLHETTTSLSASLSSLSSSLESLRNSSLPALEESSAGWKERTEGVLKERKKARVVLEQHDKIRDLLDIPILIDTCVRNGYFAEALSLASHANLLSTTTTASLSPTSPATSHPPPPILTSILAEVHHSIAQMLLSLLATLHEPTRKLPALWKAVNFLRKMDIFPPIDGIPQEDQIALAFLGGREACLKSALEGCGRDVQGLISSGLAGEELGEREKEDIARYLKKYIDLWREGVYDIVTQYSTIFLERSPESSTSLSLSSAPKSEPPSDSIPNSRITLYQLLTTYTTHALMTHLLPLLTRTLPLLSLPALPSLLTQLTYCSMAFARVGMDFRGVLGGLFCSAVARAVGKELKEAGGKWTERVISAHRRSEQLQHGKGHGMGKEREREREKEKGFIPPSQWLITPALITSPPAPPPPPMVAEKGPPHLPPQILASYPPLAEYTNALLGTFNSLRLLAPVGVLEELVDVLEACLEEGGRALLEYVRELHESKSVAWEKEKEETVARAAGEVYVRVFVPFVRRALVEGVYGVKDGLEERGERGEDGELGKMIREWEGWLCSDTIGGNE